LSFEAHSFTSNIHVMPGICRLRNNGLILLLSVLLGFNLSAQTSWPVQITAADGSKIMVYEPEAEKFAGDNLSARAAVSLRKTSGDEPVFGVMWFNSTVTSSQSFAVIKNVTVVKSKFADDDEESKTVLQAAVEKYMPGMNVQLALTKIQAELTQDKMDGNDNFKNDAPLILFRNKPTTLIVLDGEPEEQQDDDLNMVRVVNSPYLIVKNPDDRRYYLYGGSFWYSSNQVKSGWTNVKILPAKIRAIDAKMKEQEKEASAEKDETNQFTSPTDILVTTEPAELLQTEGNPTYKAVAGSTLLYVDNSLDEIFKDVETQKNYILIAGRWYNSASLSGPWNYVAPDALPAAFASIPRGSEKDGVLANVAGTDEADEAMMDARIPQTAKVERSSATCEVSYDGAPRFVPIANTNLSLAENSDLTVMLAPNNQYYALENGIWFISNNPNGPWKVANERPSDVEKIPASSSAYNARYVQIYETTPQFVYVGYTPGYMGNYVYRRTVVWGTGYRYRPWYGRRFYPRPYTWGFGMHYNPWTGWNISFGLGFNTGWYRYNRYHGHGGGWFGPPMFRPPYRPWGWNGGYYGNRPNLRPQYRPNVTTNRPPNWNNQQIIRPVRSNINIYENRRSVVTRDKIQRPSVRPANPGTRPTNPVTSPGTRPTAPVTRPGNPDFRPGTRPTTPATRPGTRPTNPVERPGTRPVTPVERPETKPTQPVTRPTQPITRPGTRPTAPVERPGRTPVERPTRQETRPVPTTRPNVSRPVPSENRGNRQPTERPAANPRNRNN